MELELLFLQFTFFLFTAKTLPVTVEEYKTNQGTQHCGFVLFFLSLLISFLSAIARCDAADYSWVEKDRKWRTLPLIRLLLNNGENIFLIGFQVWCCHSSSVPAHLDRRKAFHLSFKSNLHHFTAPGDWWMRWSFNTETCASCCMWCYR